MSILLCDAAIALLSAAAGFIVGWAVSDVRRWRAPER